MTKVTKILIFFARLNPLAPPRLAAIRSPTCRARTSVFDCRPTLDADTDPLIKFVVLLSWRRTVEWVSYHPMSDQTREPEWVLMLRGFLALCYKNASIEMLVDDEYASELTRNAYYRVSQWQCRLDYTPTLLNRLQILRHNFIGSFFLLIAATAIDFLLSYSVSRSIPNPIGVASLFFLSLGYARKTWILRKVVWR